MLESSYAEEDVSFLLTDLSSHDLERSLAEREDAVRRGRNYAEILPVERPVPSSYMKLFAELVDLLAEDVARHVGVITEIALAERQQRPVLLSLARAGTPIGILMRRWAKHVHGYDLPHFSVSIVRGIGIDNVAMDYIVSRHDAGQIVFVDGWTGKGAIVDELHRALDDYRARTGVTIPNDLAVVSDPGACATIFGTREDFLLPSACLNSTVCGLVSRTVYKPSLIGRHDFHGAKVYREFKNSDQSAWFLDQITSWFDRVSADVDRQWRAVYESDRTPTGSGMREARQIQQHFGLSDINLVKPSVGETTRVLLRRVPWKVLVNPETTVDLRHVRALAHERAVPIVDYSGLSYACVGLVRPADESDQ